MKSNSPFYFEENKVKFKELRQLGLTNINIAKYFECSLFYVEDYIKKELTYAEKRKHPTKFKLIKELTEIQIREIKRELVEGIKFSDISEKYGISWGSIRKIRNTLNLSRTNMKIFTKGEESAIISYYSSGKGKRGIAKIFKVNPSVIHRVLVNNNIKLRGVTLQNRIIGNKKAKNSIGNSFTKDVRSFTNFIWKKCYSSIENYGLKRNLKGFVLDHKHSIANLLKLAGRTGKIDILFWLCCHPANLEVISNKENSKKYTKNSITIAELKKRIKEQKRIYHKNDMDIFEYAYSSVFGNFHYNDETLLLLQFKKYVDKYGFRMGYYESNY